MSARTPAARLPQSYRQFPMRAVIAVVSASVVIVLVLAAIMLTQRPFPQPELRAIAPPSIELTAVSLVGDSTPPIAHERTSADLVNEAPTLFGLETERLTHGEVLNKWERARAGIDREFRIVDQCRTADRCSAEARRLIDLSSEGAGRSGRARLGLINRAVDLAIAPASDEKQWRVEDRWSTPFETLQSGRGDCEDYAILKYLALLDAGMSSADLKIVIVRQIAPRADHAVVAARVGGEWLILDNRTLTLVRDTSLTRAVPLFVFDQTGAWRFVSGQRSPAT